VGRHQEALTLQQQVWEQRRRVLGEEHPNTQLAGLNLAIMNLNLGRILPARRLAEQAWKGLRERLGAQHPHTQQAAKVRKSAKRMLGGQAGSDKKRRR
jgi:hypothetical protein